MMTTLDDRSTGNALSITGMDIPLAEATPTAYTSPQLRFAQQRAHLIPLGFRGLGPRTDNAKEPCARVPQAQGSQRLCCL
jgi:hypothetical protein